MQQTRDLSGTVIDNQIEILEPVGQGGMGAVYRAFHRAWNQPMAVKVPHAHLLSEADYDRFLLEAHTWIDLGIHPHIVTCWFIHPWDNVPLLFLDLLTGGNLRDEIRQGRLVPGDWGRILALAIQACDGLAHAHKLGLIHRDIKPANLLLDDSGRLCVTDFGLVKNLAQGLSPAPGTSGTLVAPGLPPADLSLSLTATGSVVGTPHYASPEQWMQDESVSPRADLYSLGVVLFEMALGRVPFDPPSGPQALASLFISHTSHPPPDPATLNRDIPEGLRDVILRCLAKDPSERPASAEEMRRQLSDVYRTTTGFAYTEIPQAAQQRADSLNNKAVSLWNLGKQSTAFGAWNEALALDAVHPESVFNRAMVLWGKGQLEPEEVARRLQTVKTTHERAAAYLGLFWLSRGLAFEAEIELKTALSAEIVTRDARFWKALGDCQMQGERLQEAQESYRRSLELSSQQVDVATRLKLASQGERPRDLDKVFPRSRALWETVLDSGPRHVYLTHDAVLVLTQQDVTSLSRSDGAVNWTRKMSEAHRLEVGEESGLWCAPGFPNTVFYSLKDGQIVTSLSEGDKHFALSSQGKAVVGNIDLWLMDLQGQTFQRQFKLAGHDKQVAAAAFSVDGSYLISGGYDRQAIVWSVRTGQPLQRQQRHKDFIESVAISPDNKFFASGSRDRTVRVHLLQSGESFREFKDHPAAIVGLEFTPNGKMLLAWCGTPANITHTFLWDVDEGSTLKRIEGHARLSRDGQYLLVGRQPAGVSILDVCRLETLAWTRAFAVNSPVMSAADSADGRYLALATQRGMVGYWEFSERTRLVPSGLHLTRTRGYRDLETSRQAFQSHLERSRKGLLNSDYKLAWSELETARALAGYNRDPEALKVASQLLAVLRRSRLRGVWEQKAVRDPSELAIGPSLWWEQGAQVLSSAGKWLRVWNSVTGSCTRGLVGHSENVTALDLAGSYAFSATSGKAMRLWNLESGECEKRFASPTVGVSWVSLHEDHGRACFFNTNQEMMWLDINSGKFFNSVRLPGFTAFSASQDWNYALTGGAPGHPCLTAWNLNAPKKLHEAKRFLQSGLGEAALQITACCVLGSGVFGLTAGLDSYLRLWDLQDARALEDYRIEPDFSSVTCISWSRDGHHFVTGHQNGSLRIWALQEKKPLRTIDGPWGRVVSCQLTHDARFLLAVVGEGSMRFWELDWELDTDGPPKTVRQLYPRPGLLARLLRGRL